MIPRRWPCLGVFGREAEVGGVKYTVDLEATMDADLDIGNQSIHIPYDRP